MLQSYEDLATKGHGVGGGDNFLSLDLWHAITASQPQELLVEMTYQGSTFWTRYFAFQVDTKAEGYKIQIGLHDPDSTAGTSLESANGMKFSTADTDQDTSLQNCALNFKRPFWNSKCGLVGPLSVYGDTNLGRGVYWQAVTGCCDSLQAISFKSRPVHCSQGEGAQCSACASGYQWIQDPKSGRNTCSPVCDASACSECHPSNPRICLGDCLNGYFSSEAGQNCQSKIHLFIPRM